MNKNVIKNLLEFIQIDNSEHHPDMQLILENLYNIQLTDGEIACLKSNKYIKIYYVGYRTSGTVFNDCRSIISTNEFLELISLCPELNFKEAKTWKKGDILKSSNTVFVCSGSKDPEFRYYRAIFGIVDHNEFVLGFNEYWEVDYVSKASESEVKVFKQDLKKLLNTLDDEELEVLNELGYLTIQ